MILDELVPEFGLEGLTEDDLDDLNRVWHRLSPWPDAIPGLTRLRTSRLLKNTRIGLFSWPSCVSRPPRQRCTRGHAVPTRGPATPAAGDQGHLASRFRNRTKL